MNEAGERARASRVVRAPWAACPRLRPFLDKRAGEGRCSLVSLVTGDSRADCTFAKLEEADAEHAAR